MRNIARATLLASLFRICMSTGYMSTIAPMWGYNNPTPGNTYAICVMQAHNLEAKCFANIDNATFLAYGQTNSPVNTSFWAVAGGGLGSCGLKYYSHSPVCWGDIEVPVQYQNLSYSDLNCGAGHACAVRDDGSGKVHCWGSPKYEHYDEIKPPVGIPMKSVTVGDWFSCGLNFSDNVVCWGSYMEDYNLTVHPQVNFERIYAGRGYLCGIEKGSKRTLCWGGSNGAGEASAPGGYNFSALSAGGAHTCGLREDNSQVICWGDNRYGQLEIPKGQKFSVIAAGDWYTCGVSLEQRLQLQCWGTFNGILPNVNVSQSLCTNNCTTDQYEQLDSEVGNQQCLKKTDKICIQLVSNSSTNSSTNSSSNSSTNSSTNSQIRNSSTNSSKNKILVILVSVLGSATLLTVAIVYYFRKGIFGKMYPNTTWKALPSSTVEFTSSELRLATQNYSQTMVLGRGAFGVVYKGVLSDGKAVAIKKATNMDESNSFDQELQLLSRLHHKCLVNLVGYCKQEKLLVFEFMASGTLSDCLFKADIKLDWISRIRIASQAAHGLEYLHAYASPTIIHRDVKSSNILLDENWHAHVADFGLSLLGPPTTIVPPPPLKILSPKIPSASHLSNMTVVGTMGYIDPEYFLTSRLTSKSDVYSFGVVLLELITGRKAIVDQEGSNNGLVSWVLAIFSEGVEYQVLDSSLDLPDDPSPLIDAMELAMECVKPTGKERPTMLAVASALDGLLTRMLSSNLPDIKASSNPASPILPASR